MVVHGNSQKLGRWRPGTVELVDAHQIGNKKLQRHAERDDETAGEHRRQTANQFTPVWPQILSLCVKMARKVSAISLLPSVKQRSTDMSRSLLDGGPRLALAADIYGPSQDQERQTENIVNPAVVEERLWPTPGERKDTKHTDSPGRVGPSHVI